MVNSIVTPETFTMVDFDHATILTAFNETRAMLEMDPDLEITVEIEEQIPLIRAEVTSIDPAHIRMDGGSLENPKLTRQFNEDGVHATFGHLLLRIRDRLTPGFGETPVDLELPIQYRAAWDCYTSGRIERLGLRGRRQRRIYQFSVRHGFTEAADAAFERLWTADDLTWADLTEISDNAAAAQPQDA